MDRTASSASKQHVLIAQMRRLMVSSRQTEKLADIPAGIAWLLLCNASGMFCSSFVWLAQGNLRISVSAVQDVATCSGSWQF